MRNWMTLFASGFGIGFITGGGTWAALLATASYMLCLPGQVALFFSSLLLYFWIVPVILRYSEDQDPLYIVLDEVVVQFGLNIIGVWLGWPWWLLLIAAGLFRFFDITKPLGISDLEAYKGAWGVLWDDVAAGGYALALTVVIQQCCIFLNIL